ncbi:hypothetical protein DM02DRAFT_401534 [Periconia macrospinosa]|uniref:Uncharacterized protein n=1 Tax=Periconia macrospinosa TaxID=97972 RepID=A0A2V1DQC7_9PLEO|nr:hypothetical protein DM02DRAFT_401534 [Periconia macrospinosa]
MGTVPMRPLFCIPYGFCSHAVFVPVRSLFPCGHCSVSRTVFVPMQPQFLYPVRSVFPVFCLHVWSAIPCGLCFCIPCGLHSRFHLVTRGLQSHAVLAPIYKNRDHETRSTTPCGLCSRIPGSKRRSKVINRTGYSTAPCNLCFGNGEKRPREKHHQHCGTLYVPK